MNYPFTEYDLKWNIQNMKQCWSWSFLFCREDFTGKFNTSYSIHNTIFISSLKISSSHFWEKHKEIFRRGDLLTPSDRPPTITRRISEGNVNKIYRRTQDNGAKGRRQKKNPKKFSGTAVKQCVRTQLTSRRIRLLLKFRSSAGLSDGERRI